MLETRYFVGLDLGQRCDPAAFAVCERMTTLGAFDPFYMTQRKTVKLGVRALERFPLGTSYVAVADRVAEVVRYLGCMGGVRLVVDATGVGRPVVDLLYERKTGALMMPVVVTAGHRETGSGDSTGVPKMDLMDALRLAIDRGGIEFSGQLRETAALVKEFSAMREMQGETGHRDVAARGRDHDDLVFAVMLACWGARKTFPRDHVG